MSKFPEYHHYTEPVKFWLYVGSVATLGVAAWITVMTHTDPGLVRFMAAGALILLAAYALGPTCLDLTFWSLTVFMMFPLGFALLLGSPVIWALWSTFVSGHVEVTIK